MSADAAAQDRKPRATPWQTFLLGPAAVLTWLFSYPACHLLFACGCTWMWSGGAAHCNIHQPAALSPHCPWCRAGLGGFTVIVIAIVACEAIALRLARQRWPQLRRRWRAVMITLALSAGFIAGLLITGLIAAWITDYPYFLGFSLQTR